MNGFLEAFLRHAFDHTFVRYDEAWLRLAEDLAHEQSALILSDIGLKYPSLIEQGLALEAALEGVLETDAPLQATFLYRISHVLFRREPQHPALAYYAQLMRVRTAIELYYSTSIGPRLRIIHGAGAIIGPRNTIGSDFTFYQGVTLGQRRQFSPHETMVIGDGCTIFAGAKVLGAVRLGDRVKVAANAVLLTDAETEGVYVGNPARRSERP
jgi:serine acetyltransferase